jgi:fatty-acyl-CoA synthase
MTTSDVTRARQHSVGDLLHRTARRYPDKPAVVAGELRVTYAEFDVAVNRAAHAMSARGLRPGDRLALLSHNCFEFAVLVFATAKLGVVLVPVNFMLGADEVAFVLQHSGARGIVAEDALAATADAALATAGVEDPIRGWVPSAGRPPAPGWEDVGPWWREGPTGAPEVLVGDDDPLRLMYTSGTGVAAQGRDAVEPLADRAVRQLRPRRRDGRRRRRGHTPCRCTTARSWTASSPSTSTSGRPASSCPGPTRPRSWRRSSGSGSRSCSALRRCGSRCCATRTSTPVICRVCARATTGASAMPGGGAARAAARLPDVRLWNFYGQTEMAPARHRSCAGRAAGASRLRRVGPPSTSRPGASRRTTSRRPGEVGEIVHRSPQATPGYWRDEEKTAEAFSGGWFHSGDLGC